MFEEIVFMFRGECFWIYNDCVKERLGNILAGRTENGGYMKRAVLDRDILSVSIALSDT